VVEQQIDAELFGMVSRARQFIILDTGLLAICRPLVRTPRGCALRCRLLQACSIRCCARSRNTLSWPF